MGQGINSRFGYYAYGKPNTVLDRKKSGHPKFGLIIFFGFAAFFAYI